MSSLSHINELFADAVFQEVRKRRFGLKICKAVVDAELADDLRNLYQRSLEQQACEQNSCTCSITTIEERINTL